MFVRVTLKDNKINNLYNVCHRKRTEHRICTTCITNTTSCFSKYKHYAQHMPIEDRNTTLSNNWVTSSLQ